MDSLFPSNTPGVGGGGANNGTTLVSFKAGKCVMEGPRDNGKFSVSPDLRKGTASLVRSSDGAVKFMWTDRNGVVEEGNEKFLFGDTSFNKVNTGKPTDRVYSLKYDADRDPLMFWMQDKSSEKDTEFCTKINDLANNPQAASAAAAAVNSGAGSAIPGANTALGGGDPSDPLSAVLAQLAMSSGGGGLPATPAAPGAASSGLTSEAFRNIMAGAGSAAPPAAPTQAQAPLELQDIVQADAVLASSLLEDETVVASLIAQLPEGQQTREG